MVSPLHVSTYANEGGAGRAAYRLHEGLQDAGLNSRVLSLFDDTDDSSVVRPQTQQSYWRNRFRYILDHLPAAPALLGDALGLFSPGWLSSDAPATINRLAPDVAHLHWVAGFLTPGDIAAIDVPVVWTLHDMWSFTGGCHYSGGCKKFTTQCQDCPGFPGSIRHDPSAWLFNRKQNAWGNVEMTIVSPSEWLADQARQSTLLGDSRIEVIPNGINTSVWEPQPGHAERQFRLERGIPTDDPVVLYCIADASERKGLSSLREVLMDVSRERDIVAVGFGGSENAQPSLPGYQLDYVPDAAMPTLYSMADVFVAPSKQDNLPNTVLESLACGTACVGYETGGVPDMVTHKESGYLAPSGDRNALTEGIHWSLTGERPKTMGERARETVESRFALSDVASQYCDLYRSVY